LVSHPAVRCESAEYRAVYPLFLIVLIVIVCLVPVLLALLLTKYRKRLSEPSFINRFGVLFIYYTPSNFFWEVLITVRKISLISMMVFLKTSNELYSFITVLNLLFMLAHLYAHPYQAQADNKRESVTLVVLALCTALLSNAPSPLTLDYQIPLSLLIILASLSILASIALARFKTLVLKCKCCSCLHGWARSNRASVVSSAKAKTLPELDTSPDSKPQNTTVVEMQVFSPSPPLRNTFFTESVKAEAKANSATELPLSLKDVDSGSTDLNHSLAITANPEPANTNLV
jgi:hypothetical protein